MGKRKRRAEPKKHLVSSLMSDVMPCSLGVDSSSEEKISSVISLVDPGSERILPSVMDTKDVSTKNSQNAQPSLAHHRHSLSRSMLLRRSLHHYGHHLSKRNAGIHADSLSSFHKNASLLSDERHSSKLFGRYNSGSGNCSGSLFSPLEIREKTLHRPERIKLNPLVIDAKPPDMVKMVCGICMKFLSMKRCGLGNTLSSGDLSVVAILVCGHVYHVDCLEQRTSEEDKRDPHCPLCVDLHLEVDFSKEQK